MADRERRNRDAIDYTLLQRFSTADLYFSGKNKSGRPGSKLYLIDRLISRRKCGQDYEYLIKWKGWSMLSCTWEPSSHLSEELIRGYNTPPRPTEDDLAQASDNLYLAVVSLLKSNAVKACHSTQFSMKHDVYRYLFKDRGISSRDKKHIMLCLEDFDRLCLPKHWWYVLDGNGQGQAIDFPLKLRAYLGMSPKHFIAPRIPLEKVSIIINIKVYSMK